MFINENKDTVNSYQYYMVSEIFRSSLWISIFYCQDLDLCYFRSVFGFLSAVWTVCVQRVQLALQRNQNLENSVAALLHNCLLCTVVVRVPWNYIVSSDCSDLQLRTLLSFTHSTESTCSRRCPLHHRPYHNNKCCSASCGPANIGHLPRVVLGAWPL